jgi:hypothetical protein
MEKPKVTIVTPKLSKHRKDSFWYRGSNQIAIVELNGRIMSVEPRGEIRIQFAPNGEIFKNEQAIEEAIRRKLGDKKIAKVSEFDGWHNNNWFVVIEIDKKGNDISDDLEIEYNYDDAIQMAIDILEDETE